VVRVVATVREAVDEDLPVVPVDHDDVAVGPPCVLVRVAVGDDHRVRTGPGVALRRPALDERDAERLGELVGGDCRVGHDGAGVRPLEVVPADRAVQRRGVEVAEPLPGPKLSAVGASAGASGDATNPRAVSRPAAGVSTDSALAAPLARPSAPTTPTPFRRTALRVTFGSINTASTPL
jgi:hypothetical protein